MNDSSTTLRFAVLSVLVAIVSFSTGSILDDLKQRVGVRANQSSSPEMPTITSPSTPPPQKRVPNEPRGHYEDIGGATAAIALPAKLAGLVQSGRACLIRFVPPPHSANPGLNPLIASGIARIRFSRSESVENSIEASLSSAGLSGTSAPDPFLLRGPIIGNTLTLLVAQGDLTEDGYFALKLEFDGSNRYINGEYKAGLENGKVEIDASSSE